MFCPPERSLIQCHWKSRSFVETSALTYEFFHERPPAKITKQRRPLEQKLFSSFIGCIGYCQVSVVIHDLFLKSKDANFANRMKTVGLTYSCELGQN